MEAVPFVIMAIGNQLQGRADQGQGLLRFLFPVLVPFGQFLAGEAVGGVGGKHLFPEGHGPFPVLVAFQVEGQLPPRLAGHGLIAGTA